MTGVGRPTTSALLIVGAMTVFSLTAEFRSLSATMPAIGKGI